MIKSSEEFISEAREAHLSKSLDVASNVTRTIFMLFAVSSPLFPIIGLLQTNYVSPNFYRFPGIPATSVFFYPVNIIGQFLVYFSALFLYVAMDCLFIIYMFYFRGEIQSITAIAKLLSQKENVTLNCDRILRSIYEAQRELLKGFYCFSPVFWHYYFHKLLAVILLTCSSFFTYSQSNSVVSGMAMQMMTISLLFMHCMPGQLLDNCSSKLEKTLYESLWYEMNQTGKRNFLLIFKGAQRNIKVKTMGINQISLHTWVQVDY
ncbi:hypothetical protein DMENIID0001_054630 [Sergentomyia squamirostris]